MKQARKLGRNNHIGAIGERIAAKYVSKRGLEIVTINYLKKWGEIDIVARETVHHSTTVHFVEVKTVSYETKVLLHEAVARRTWRPEENVHFRKIQRMNRAIESWIMENDYNGEWQIDVVAIRIVAREKFASVKYLPNIIFE